MAESILDEKAGAVYKLLLLCDRLVNKKGVFV